MTMMFAERLRRLKQQLTAANVDFLALVPGPNLVYFTGLRMHLSERPIVALLPANDAPPILIAPAFEVGKASAELAWRTYSYADGTPIRRPSRLPQMPATSTARRSRSSRWACG